MQCTVMPIFVGIVRDQYDAAQDTTHIKSTQFGYIPPPLLFVWFCKSTNDRTKEFSLKIIVSLASGKLELLISLISEILRHMLKSDVVL